MTRNEQTVDFSKSFEVDCIDAAGSNRQNRDVVCETPLTIEIKDVGTYTIMSTPCDTVALAVGFAFSEGLIERREDIDVLMKCPDDPNVIRMQLRENHAPQPGRNLMIISSCGICGSEDIDKVIDSLPVVQDTLRVTKEELTEMPDLLIPSQQLFKRTGAAHAAGIIRDSTLLAACEDLGRHSAMDKVIGLCLLQGIPTENTAVVLSGRVSFELVAKAARAQIELIAAVSAPTSLAIETAQRCNLTLCGFVRGPQANIYTHPHRVRSLDNKTPSTLNPNI
jgi:FdhD protein